MADCRRQAGLAYWRFLAFTFVRLSLQSPGRYVLQGVLSILVMAAFFWLWAAVDQAGDLASDQWNLQSILWYLFGVRVWFAGRISVATQLHTDIKLGSATGDLLQPRSYIARWVLRGALAGCGRAAITAAMCLPVALWLANSPPPLTMLALPLLLLGGWGLETLIALVVSAPGLAGADLAAIESIYGKVVMLLSGTFFPLSLVAPVAAIAVWTPFPLVAYVPVSLAVNPSAVVVSEWLPSLVGWLLATVAAAHWFVRLNVRRLSLDGS